MYGVLNTFSIYFIQLMKLHSETAESIGTRMTRHYDPDTAFWKAAITDSVATNLRHCDKALSATVSRMLIATVEECIRTSEARESKPRPWLSCRNRCGNDCLRHPFYFNGPSRYLQRLLLLLLLRPGYQPLHRPKYQGSTPP